MDTALAPTLIVSGAGDEEICLAALKSLEAELPASTFDKHRNAWSNLCDSLIQRNQQNDPSVHVAKILDFVMLVQPLSAALNAFRMKAMPQPDVNQPAASTQANEGLIEANDSAKAEDTVQYRRERRRSEVRDALTRGHVIRIAKKEDRIRAMGVLGGVPFAYHSCGLDEFIVMGVHINALQAENVSFEDITKRS